MVSSNLIAFYDTKPCNRLREMNFPLGGVALDVYKEEESVFFEDHSYTGLKDDVLSRLLTFPNILITSNQAFLTNEALSAIASVTLDSIRRFCPDQTPVGERLLV